MAILNQYPLAMDPKDLRPLSVDAFLLGGQP